ncbi:VTC domain-containing protein, partial [Flavobacteriaceae bacterium]|nr:VTC domain-containing protein [Flavobacteriaceae bacterium]
WYGYNDIFSLDKINIEKKCKWNGLGWKEKFMIDFVCNRKLEQIVKYLKRDHNFFCIPTISNSYEREYFENTQGVRITIDKNIVYFKPGSLFQKRESHFVLEIKFDKDSFFDSSILNEIDLIISKNSKYVNGINIFKK